jgi:hypothetical protein
MSTTFCIAPDRQEKDVAVTPTASILWVEDVAYAGFKADFEVKTAHIGRRTKVKITCRTHDGTLIDTAEGKVDFNYYYGKILIPFTIKSSNHVYLEIHLPEYGIISESNYIPVRTSIRVNSI